MLVVAENALIYASVVLFERSAATRASIDDRCGSAKLAVAANRQETGGGWPANAFCSTCGKSVESARCLMPFYRTRSPLDTDSVAPRRVGQLP